MEYNPMKLRPAELVQMLNFFLHLGTVTDRDRIFRHRQQTGFRISTDGRTINLLKYLAWLVDERQPTTKRLKLSELLKGTRGH